MSNLVVLKLGGSVITRKDAGEAKIAASNLGRVSGEVAEALNEGDLKLLIVHGAGPFGHNPAREYGLEGGLGGRRQIHGFVVTHHSMEKLNYGVVEALQSKGLNAMAFQPSSCGILRERDLVYFPLRVIEKLISIGVIPVGYGDVLLDEESGVGILSGDHLVSYLAEKLMAKRIVMAADVGGVFDCDPKKNVNAHLIPEINLGNIRELEIGGAKSTDVTGGMKRKVMELMRIARSGREIQVVSGIGAGVLKKALLGEHVGTLISGMPARG